ncbi:MAG: DUF2171 domain-containing protein [Chloroflexota bacterium]
MAKEEKKIRHGAKVVDKEGTALGTVDHVARDSWTGEIGKFIVRREAPAHDIFLEPKDVEEVSDEEVKLNKTVEEEQSK